MLKLTIATLALTMAAQADDAPPPRNADLLLACTYHTQVTQTLRIWFEERKLEKPGNGTQPVVIPLVTLNEGTIAYERAGASGRPLLFGTIDRSSGSMWERTGRIDEKPTLAIAHCVPVKPQF
jgi:hypothetical protein